MGDEPHALQVAEWTDRSEHELLDALSPDEPWELVTTFAGLTRESGTEPERQAAEYVVDRLREPGISYQVYRPTLYISLPRGASVEVLGSEQRLIDAKTPSFSAATNGQIEGELIFVPSAETRTDADLFKVSVTPRGDIDGRIALSDGLPTPRKVADLTVAMDEVASLSNVLERFYDRVRSFNG
jgi:N-acetylated-alpha-linked acidic dipeptidase